MERSRFTRSSRHETKVNPPTVYASSSNIPFCVSMIVSQCLIMWGVLLHIWDVRAFTTLRYPCVKRQWPTLIRHSIISCLLYFLLTRVTYVATGFIFNRLDRFIFYFFLYFLMLYPLLSWIYYFCLTWSHEQLGLISKIPLWDWTLTKIIFLLCFSFPTIGLILVVFLSSWISYQQLLMSIKFSILLNLSLSM